MLPEELRNSADFIASWSDPDSFKDLKKKPDGQIQLTVDVNAGDWAELVVQAAIHARAIGSISPMCAFTVAFAYNNATCEFRVLIFHSGGLTASERLDLRNQNARKSLHKMLFCMMLWQDAEDAGFPCFTDGENFKIPRKDGECADYKLEKTLHQSTSLRGARTWVSQIRQKPQSGAHGCGELLTINTNFLR